MEINKIWLSLTECWQIKAIASFLVTGFTFLVGTIEAPFIALWLLVTMDTLTKWAAVSKKTAESAQTECNIWYGFYLAWHTGVLNSHAMRHQFATKLFAYFMLIVAGNLVSKIIPSISLFGSDISRIPGGFVYSFLAVTELMSIIENLIEMGMDVLKPLAVWACKKRDDMTGNIKGGTSNATSNPGSHSDNG